MIGKGWKVFPLQNYSPFSLKKFEECKIYYVKREHNLIVDSLASLGSAITFHPKDLVRSFEINKLEQPSYIPKIETLLAEEVEIS